MRQVTVLGGCGAFPEPGRACSGFAVDWDGYRLVLDLGYATLPRLLAHWPDGVLDAVAITHEWDSGPDPALAELGRDADLFIIESTDRAGETQRPERNLMTSAEAGRYGRQAGARRLMLTHFWPGTDRSASIAAASAEFHGTVLEATEDLTVALQR
jgi:ribonuclease BN (tRNA processing enzyme)